jgi:hypothetical protein
MEYTYGDGEASYVSALKEDIKTIQRKMTREEKRE